MPGDRMVRERTGGRVHTKFGKPDVVTDKNLGSESQLLLDAIRPNLHQPGG